MSEAIVRHLALSPELIRAYSRRGNFHSEASDAAALGLPGLVAQGTQVCGPAYGALLDAWGEAFLDHGSIDLRFVAMAIDNDELMATVTIADDGAAAAISVENTTTGSVAAVGTARRENELR